MASGLLGGDSPVAQIGTERPESRHVSAESRVAAISEPLKMISGRRKAPVREKEGAVPATRPPPAAFRGSGG